MTNLERSKSSTNVKRSNTLKSLRRAGTEIKRAGTGLKRAGTGGLKRAGTGLKRAGTGAWKWINADDVEFDNTTQPMGRTFFQRSDTYKRLQKQKQLEEGTTGNIKPSLSDEQLNIEQQPQYQEPESQYQEPKPQPQRPQLSAYEQELEQRHREIQRQKQLRLQQEAALKGEDYIDEIEEPIRPKKKNKESNEEKRKSKIPKALYDPEVRKQLEELKQHKPFFMYTVTIIQILLMIVCIIVNYIYTGHLFDNMKNNVQYKYNLR